MDNETVTMSRTNDQFSNATAIEIPVSGIAEYLAHDFNNVLTGILGNLELLQRRATRQGITFMDDYLASARGAASRGVSLTQILTAMAGLQILDPTALHTQHFLESLSALLNEILGEQRPLQINCPQSVDNIYCDAFKLEGALAGIAKHASHTAENSAPVTLTAVNLNIDAGHNALQDIAPGRYVAIILQYTTAAEAPGDMFTAGLELASAQGFARQSGGQALLDTGEPGYVKISLVLPTASEQPASVR
ncbi:MAG: hypothetical protein POG74_01195 [Acidocella sp.]|nr:hypothetical protein [Acidocella sp.]